MDHKIDTLATLHNWTQGAPSLYPFTGIIQLYLAEEISVATAVGEISGFIGGKKEGVDECVHDLWGSILHAGRCLPSHTTSIIPTGILSATPDTNVIKSNGNAKVRGIKMKKKKRDRLTIDTDISSRQTPTPPQKKLIALMHAIKDMPDVYVHIRTRPQSRYSYSSSSQLYSGGRGDRYHSCSGDIAEKNEDENEDANVNVNVDVDDPAKPEGNGQGDEGGESTEEEELYHPSLGLYLDGTVGESHYIRHLHDSTSTPVPHPPIPPPRSSSSGLGKGHITTTTPQTQTQEDTNRPNPPKIQSSASESTIRPTKIKCLVWAYLPHFRDVVESVFTDFGDLLGLNGDFFPLLQQQQHPPPSTQKIHTKDQKMVIYQAWINFITFLAFLAKEGVLYSPRDINTGYKYGFDEYDWGLDDLHNDHDGDDGDGIGSWIDDLAICFLRLLNTRHPHHQHLKDLEAAEKKSEEQEQDNLERNTTICTATTFALLYGDHLWRRRGDPTPLDSSSPPHNQEVQEKKKEKGKEKEKEKEKEYDNCIVAGLTLDEFESGSVSTSTSTSAVASAAASGANSPSLSVSASIPPQDNAAGAEDEDEGESSGKGRRFITRKTWESWIRRFNHLAGDLREGSTLGLWDETREGAWLAGEELRRVYTAHYHGGSNSDGTSNGVGDG
ncbi:hypothetical protein ASPBRDRAFT_75991 [Aspergillus brasiliensis CBS 101740]|uniref:Uncharacterized protein n=1 Tax=Aspergillus brasiliensis (strain CBS 101740 / IMI 381727 / IBT 21946) TaxID=767769 RepID=A0A1L9UIE2_ASPBC|nr:hypothetical protein ASPBRDRAFT_75991 [Aspergillus brasiliensis CBS 101740]